MTLSEHLQRAKVDRAEQRGARVDDYVIDPDGVTDLSATANDIAANPAPKMPMLPKVGNSDVEGLYGD
jgi:hypothetical protein